MYKHKHNQISFGRLVEPSAVSRQSRDPLVDLTTQKKVATHGGLSRDPAFRLTLLEANGRTCCVCGQIFSVNGSTAMEAAHVIPRGKRGADSVLNALCLCPLHHWAFDRGLWCLDESLVIQVALSAQRQAAPTADWLVNFHNMPATFCKEPRVSMEALDWHRQNVFLDSDETSE